MESPAVIIEELKNLFDDIEYFSEFICNLTTNDSIGIDDDLNIRLERSKIESKINEMSIYFNSLIPLKDRFEIIRNYYIEKVLPDACKWTEVKTEKEG